MTGQGSARDVEQAARGLREKTLDLEEAMRIGKKDGDQVHHVFRFILAPFLITLRFPPPSPSKLVPPLVPPPSPLVSS